MAVIGLEVVVVLVGVQAGSGVEKVGSLGAYMEAPLELSVPSELHAHHLVQQQAHEVEGLRHRAALVPGFGHGGDAV